MAPEARSIQQEPGIYLDLSFEEYAAIDAVNSSLLNQFRRTPAHALHFLQTGGGETSTAKELGRLSHAHLFEPEKVDEEFLIAPKVDKRFKEGKAKWAEIEAQANGRAIVIEEVAARARASAENVRAHETAAEFFSGWGQNEVTIVWDDALGVRCKARIDRISLINEWPVIGDLKTSRDASRSAFGRSVLNFGYDVQAVHYLTGLEAISPVPAGNPFRRFIFFVVESDPPHCVASYELDDATLEEGARKRERYIRLWKECVSTGVFPGYPPGIDYASLPAWAFRSWDE